VGVILDFPSTRKTDIQASFQLNQLSNSLVDPDKNKCKIFPPPNPMLCPFPKEEFENEIYLPSVKATCPASFVTISNVSNYAVCVLKTLDKFIIGFGGGNILHLFLSGSTKLFDS
jgi:hypothetical protein